MEYSLTDLSRHSLPHQFPPSLIKISYFFTPLQQPHIRRAKQWSSSLPSVPAWVWLGVSESRINFFTCYQDEYGEWIKDPLHYLVLPGWVWWVNKGSISLPVTKMSMVWWVNQGSTSLPSVTRLYMVREARIHFITYCYQVEYGEWSKDPLHYLVLPGGIWWVRQGSSSLPSVTG